MKKKDREFLYEYIIDGVIGWYNYSGRVGKWYDFNDGLDTIEAMKTSYIEDEEFEKAQEMKDAYDELKVYMVEEGLYDKGVLPEYKQDKDE